MDPETFILRKNFLEELYKERVNFTFEKDILRDEYKGYINKLLTYETNVLYPETFNLGFAKRIIPFIFYLNSLYGCYLNNDIIITGFDTELFFNDDPVTKYRFFSLVLFEDRHNFNYLSYLNKEVDKYKKYKIYTVPFVPFNVRVEFSIGVKTNLNKKPINSIQTFKSDECVICLTNQPIILFCNCGHIPICTECYKLKSLSSCPVCKTENEIIRMLE